MKEPCNEMGLKSEDFTASMCSECNTRSLNLDKNSLLLIFQAKWYFSVLTVLLSSLLAGI